MMDPIVLPLTFALGICCGIVLDALVLRPIEDWRAMHLRRHPVARSDGDERRHERR